jgi:sulfofructose kinase
MAVIDFVFELERMPRKAEKYRADAAEIVGGGGAANAAVTVARLGGDAHLFGRIGNDQIGNLILNELEAEHINCSGLVQCEGGRSSYSSVLIDANGERQIVNFRGEGLEVDPASLDFGDYDVALYDTRWEAGAAALLADALSKGKPAVVDAEAPVSKKLVEDASHVAFSAQGFRDFTRCDRLEEGLATCNLPGWVAITDGGNGVLTRDGWIAPYAVKAVDSLGAGDVWHGAFALALGEGADEREAVHFANAAAASSSKACRYWAAAHAGAAETTAWVSTESPFSVSTTNPLGILRTACTSVSVCTVSAGSACTRASIKS